MNTKEIKAHYQRIGKPIPPEVDSIPEKTVSVPKMNTGEAELITHLHRLATAVPMPRCQEHPQGQWHVREDSSMHTPDWRCDAVWRDQKVVVEIDGGVHAIAAMRDRDCRKRNALILNGYIVLTYTIEYLRKDPYLVVREIVFALWQRGMTNARLVS